MRSFSPDGLGVVVDGQSQQINLINSARRDPSWRKRLACSALFVLFPLAAGTTAELLRCEDYWCLSVRPSDQVQESIGPFVLSTSDPYLPEDDLHTLAELAQTYATLYYSQYEELRRLENTQASCCPTDIDGNGEVGMSDIVRILAAWGQQCDTSNCGSSSLE